MKSFSWLHLTDTHFGMNGQGSVWPNVREKFFDDLSRLHEKVGQLNAVLISGDITQSGRTEEFSSFNKYLLDPLRDRLESLGSRDVAILAVPGNHDLVRPDARRPSAALRQLLRKGGLAEVAEEFWEDPDCEYRRLVASAFLSYEEWAKELPRPSSLIKGTLPGDFAATLNLSAGGAGDLKIGIAGINTAFLQLTGGDYSQRLACDPRQLHEACGKDMPFWTSQHDARLLMTHHGPDWLDKTSLDNAYPEIYPADRFCVHLFGHMHETAMRSLVSGGGGVFRHWQTRSLFGLEHHGEPPQIAERKHGYSVGRLMFGEDGPTIQRWPRRAYFDSNGWRFEPDHENSVLIEGDSCTEPEFIRTPVAGMTRSEAKTLKNLHASGHSIVAPSKGQKETKTSPSSNLWPAKNPHLKSYCEAICNAHSHIRFVEIPLLKDMSDVGLDNLYVEPKFSVTEIHPDVPVQRWPKCATAIDALQKHQNLVVLGDPGSGKSTLVSCISWQLCRPEPPPGNVWAIAFGGCCPFPIILRELRLKSDITWEGLLDAFLEHRIGRLLGGRAIVEELLGSGRAVIMLDGLDEIGNLIIRRRLRDAVHAGMAAYPKSRWILTSRVVGYEAVPFHFKSEKISACIKTTAEVVSETEKTKKVQTPMAHTLYLAPFNDDQIQQFSDNWYSQHAENSILGKQGAIGFVSAVKEHEGTQRLARIPYLLTLMALIHHKNMRLPHGRIELYERIAAAYLESIDLRRQLDQLPYSLAQKKRWLAYIAYQMQLQRTKKSATSRQSQILASKKEVKQWLKEAMDESSATGTREEIEILINYFATRSGLLLPRGEGMFAFMHLSIQEYFAACFLEPRLAASRFSPRKPRSGPSNEQLRSWASNEAWRETYVLLFELISQKSVVETEDFLNHIFAGDLVGESNVATPGLLAEISTDPFVFLLAETRRRCLQQCWRWVFTQNTHHFRARRSSRGMLGSEIVRALVRDSQGDLQKAWKRASISKPELRNVKSFSLAGCSNVIDISPIKAMPAIRALDLEGCASIVNWDELFSLPQLEALNLQRCNIPQSMLNRLCDFKKIRSLIVSDVVDFEVIAKLQDLEDLHLHYRGKPTQDFTPLAAMEKLAGLCTMYFDNPVHLSDELRQHPEKIKSPAVRFLLSRGGNIKKVYADSLVKSRNIFARTGPRRR